MIVLDTSGIVALIDEAEPAHADVRAVFDSEAGPFLLSPMVLTETDYLLRTRLGRAAEVAFLADVARGSYQVEAWEADDVASAIRIIRRYGDLDIGLADASIVVLAARHRTNRILTLDERHFRAMRPLQGRSFKLLPADA